MLPILWSTGEVMTLAASGVAMGGGLIAAATSPDYMGQAALITAYTGMATGLAGLVSAIGLTAVKLISEWRKGGKTLVSIETMTAAIERAVTVEREHDKVTVKEERDRESAKIKAELAVALAESRKESKEDLAAIELIVTESYRRIERGKSQERVGPDI